MKIIFTTLVMVCCSLVGYPQTYADFEVSTVGLDTFQIEAQIKTPLNKDQGIYQLAATAPGTYQTMNIGRYVHDFQAFDKKGKVLDVSRVNVNQLKIDKPHKLAKIQYKVAESFDTEVEEFPIYLMCGSSIEADHTLINPHTIIGYFQGMQGAPIGIKVAGKDGWKTGTALAKDGPYFIAEDFDHAVDSPILMGDLTFADTTIADTQVEIYTYSANDVWNSQILLTDMSDMLDAARRFLVDLPVDRYTFLYFFEPDPPGVTGAWEHSYSSEYVITERPVNQKSRDAMIDIASHEFFHIVTPLNIHSEIVESFNFVTPTPSVHLWMYEGVTEWASNMVLYRGGVFDLETYLDNAIANKILVDEKYYDSDWSLKKLSDESFTGGKGAQQYGNIYYRGSLFAGMLDIRLLEWSDGEYGLRELVLDLIERYGKGRPVSEQTFFDDIAQMTYPGIKSLFNQHVLDNQPLPHEEYLAIIGLELMRSKKGEISVEKMKEMTEKQQRLFEAWSKNMVIEE